MWQLLPADFVSHLAMKLTEEPLAAAISLTPCLKTTWSSAILRASVCPRLTSTWPGAHSPFDDSTAMPAGAIPFLIAASRRSSLDTEETW